MDWNKGYRAKYYATIIDPVTSENLDTIDITGGTIQHTDDELLESADIDVADYEFEGEKWIRVWFDTFQESGSVGHTPLFTGIASTPSKKYNGVVQSSSIQCYSVLKPAQDVLLQRGWYAPVDIPGRAILRELLESTGINLSFTEDTDARLTNSILAEDGENRLSMAWKIADAMGWIIQILGDGTVRIGPYDNNPKWVFDKDGYDILEMSIDIERDWFNCPNVFRAILGDNVAIARDDDPASDLSTVSRGREIWAEETDVVLNTDQSLGEYAVERLKEYQNASLKVNYDRRFVPNILVGDIITLNYPEQTLVGNYLIVSQSITLGYNAKTAEEVTML